jgi:hypothetical protein
MDVDGILDIPSDELQFLYPNDLPEDRFDPRFTTLRVPRNGLRRWDSFEEDPVYLQKFMKRPTKYPKTWEPVTVPWTRFAGSETLVVDRLKSTLMVRVNVALDVISPGLAIIGTAIHFPSYGTEDNRLEGESEKLIGPDLKVLDGNLEYPPDLVDLQSKMPAFGEVKLKHPLKTKYSEKLLPGTIGCYESWLAQAVQCCIDLDLPLGWVQTNLEVVFFQLSRCYDGVSWENTIVTRSSNQYSSRLEYLPSEGPQESEFSSPVVRLTHHWDRFEDGDEEVPFIHDSIKPKQFMTPLRKTKASLDTPKRPQKTPLRELGALESSPLLKSPRIHN